LNPFCLLISAVGVFVIAGRLRDWPWFWHSSRARFAVFLLTRTGARILYVTVGIGFVILGIWSCIDAPSRPFDG
jgi:hypothetical protein